mgnify:CR=1 FL=1|jgi:hypothetical protein|tara:strand:+ start:613 stop:945 length:333 start_codon:yes stop_codon:yes gene_type:complete
MKQQLHAVKLLVPTSELGELFSWVAELGGTTLVSTSIAESFSDNGGTKNGNAEDPRVVRSEDGRIVIGESLTGLGLTENYLRSAVTKCGTSEHKVKMAILRRKGSKAVAK